MKIIKAKTSKISNVDFENLTFGKQFTDHMFICDYNNNTWNNARIVPYQNIEISPSARVFHYGQAIFEGMKAYKNSSGEIFMFRPDENFIRFNKSSRRLAIPEIDKEIFFNGLVELLKIDSNWIKEGYENSLYIRPFVIASEPTISASEALEYSFMIICTPAKAYYQNQEIWVKVEEKFSRAAKGGVGYAKASGNFAAQFYPTKIARDEGYQQIIWTDSNQHNLIEEAGTMNLFFRLNNTLITSPTSDSILDGITRKSIIDIAKFMNIDVDERPISVDELVDSHKNGTLKEIFGTGTAVTILPIHGFGFKKNKYKLLNSGNSFASRLKKTLHEIQFGEISNFSDWQFKVN